MQMMLLSQTWWGTTGWTTSPGKVNIPLLKKLCVIKTDNLQSGMNQNLTLMVRKRRQMSWRMLSEEFPRMRCDHQQLSSGPDPTDLAVTEETAVRRFMEKGCGCQLRLRGPCLAGSPSTVF